jgi:hypothetical protein
MFDGMAIGAFDSAGRCRQTLAVAPREQVATPARLLHRAIDLVRKRAFVPRRFAMCFIPLLQQGQRLVAI